MKVFVRDIVFVGIFQQAINVSEHLLKHILPTCLETPTSNAAGETLFFELLEKGIEREREIPWRIPSGKLT